MNQAPMNFKSESNTLGRLFQLALPHWPKVLTALVLLGVSAAGAIYLPLLLQKAVDGPLTHPGPESWKELNRYGLLYLAALAATMGAGFFQIYLLAQTGQGVMKNLREKLLSRFLFQKQAWLQAQPIGKLVSGVTSDVGTVSEFFNTLFTSLLKDLVVMVSAVLALLALSPQLAPVVILSLIPAVILIFLFRWRSREAFRRSRAALAGVTTFLSEHLAGMSLVQLFVRETKVKEDFRLENQGLLKANLGELYVNATFRPMIDLLYSVSLGVVLWMGSRLVLSQEIPIGVLIAFVSLLGQFYQPLGSIAENFSTLQSAMAGAERSFAFLDASDPVIDHGQLTLRESTPLELTFKDVHFAYNPAEPVLRGLSFTIPKGHTVALVGYTGAGKSTVTSLVTRFWEADEGRILLDGNDVRDYTLNSLRSGVQTVLQDVTLFDGTLRENLSMGLTYSLQELESVAEQACLSGLVKTLPQGWDTKLGEGAHRLSAGERQLVAIARVLLQNPGLLILDEATAHIDTGTEVLIQKALKAVLKGRTSLVIAHRLSTIAHADRILVLDQGRIAEEGTHDQLMALGGFYYNLYLLQFSQETESKIS